MVLPPRVFALLSMALVTLGACAFGTDTHAPPAPTSGRFIPCAAAAPIIWAPGSVDDSLTGAALEDSRQKALDKIAHVLNSGDKSNPLWRASAIALIREIAGDPSDVAGQIKQANAVYEERCPTLEMPPADARSPPRPTP